MSEDSHWFVLGFTSDAVVCAGQDARLANECRRAWEAADRPSDFEIRQGPGAGRYLLHWFVNHVAATVLDDHGIEWRQFATGASAAPPSGAELIDAGYLPAAG